MSNREFANVVMEVAWMATGYLRGVARREGTGGLSVPQLRTLGFLQRNQGASLSAVADMLGLTLSAASKLVDALVERELLTRESSPTDRRRVTLCVTANGKQILEETRERTLLQLEQLLEGFTEEERSAMMQSLEKLRGAFVAESRG